MIKGFSRRILEYFLWRLGVFSSLEHSSLMKKTQTQIFLQKNCFIDVTEYQKILARNHGLNGSMFCCFLFEILFWKKCLQQFVKKIKPQLWYELLQSQLSPLNERKGRKIKQNDDIFLMVYTLMQCNFQLLTSKLIFVAFDLLYRSKSKYLRRNVHRNSSIQN